MPGPDAAPAARRGAERGGALWAHCIAPGQNRCRRGTGPERDRLLPIAPLRLCQTFPSGAACGTGYARSQDRGREDGDGMAGRPDRPQGWRLTWSRFGWAAVASLALHAAAGAGIALGLAWRAAPPAALPEAAVSLVWQDAPEASQPAPASPTLLPASPAPAEPTPLAPQPAEGLEPEDALATMADAMMPPPPLSLGPLSSASPASASLASAPMPSPSLVPPAESPPAEAPSQVAALPIPPLPAPPPMAAEAGPETEEMLPLPPPEPPAAPQRSPPARSTEPHRSEPHRSEPHRSEPRPAEPRPTEARPPRQPQPAALATPAPAAPASPAAIPVLTGAPRFRRPPAPPRYPEQARDAGIEGTALLRLRVAADGTTRDIRLLRSTGNRELDAAAEAAARRWEIAPALENGRPIEAWVDIPVRFRIDD